MVYNYIMNTKMNPQIKSLWVAALRSGDYVQGQGRLRTDDNKFCCFGVLCNLHAQAHPEIASTQSDPRYYMGNDAMPVSDVRNWAGLPVTYNRVRINDGYFTLSHHNDKGATFLEIANAIEAQM